MKAQLTREQILALKPEGVDAAGMQDAIANVGELQAGLRQRLAEIAIGQTGPALAISDREFEAGRREAEMLDLADRRITELLSQMDAELAVLRAKETMAALQRQAPPVVEAVAALEKWLENDLQKIKRMMTAGFALQEEADRLRRDFMEQVDLAYRDVELRKLGSLGVELPQLPEKMPTTFLLSRS